MSYEGKVIQRDIEDPYFDRLKDYLRRRVGDKSLNWSFAYFLGEPEDHIPLSKEDVFKFTFGWMDEITQLHNHFGGSYRASTRDDGHQFYYLKGRSDSLTKWSAYMAAEFDGSRSAQICFTRCLGSFCGAHLSPEDGLGRLAYLYWRVTENTSYDRLDSLAQQIIDENLDIEQIIGALGLSGYVDDDWYFAFNNFRNVPNTTILLSLAFFRKLTDLRREHGLVSLADMLPAE